MNLEQVSSSHLPPRRRYHHSHLPLLPPSLAQISVVMDRFETQFEDLDVQTSTMEGVMGSTVASSTPQDQVDLLMAKVADENGLELGQKMEGLAGKVGTIAEPQQTEKEPAVKESGDEDRLAQRLRALRPAT